jgi:sigma-E factor negative regulatory protein RseA
MTQHEMNEESMSAMSALVDGELDAEALKSVLSGFADGSEACGRWDCYHLIGDALRHGDLVELLPSANFVTVTMSRIAAMEAQGVGAMPVLDVVQELPLEKASRDAANDSFRWKLVAGVSSLAAVAVVGWAGLGFGGLGHMSPAVVATASTGPSFLASGSVGVDGGGGPELAAAGPVEDVSAQPVLRSAELDRYLAAHSQAVGGAALQTTGSFVRNASFNSMDDGQ